MSGKVKTSSLLAALTVVLLVIGCGGEPTRHPTPVASIVTPVAPTPDIPVLLTGSGDRLVLPTLTPAVEGSGNLVPLIPVGGEATAVPGETGFGRPTPVLGFDGVSGEGSGKRPSGEGLVTDPVVEVVLTEEEIDSAVILRRPSCVDDFRARLINYRGPEFFGAEVARRLSEEMVESRPDCVEEGWSPEFSILAVCKRVRVTGERDSSVPNVFTVKNLGERRLGPSMRELAYGRILLHFSRMPFRDEGGCWYYRADHRRWYWNVRGSGLRPDGSGGGVVQDVEWGRDEPVFEQCDALLGILVPKLIGAGAELDSLLVADAIDRVRLQVPEHCSAVGPYGHYLWSTYPSDLPQQECPVQQGTGGLGDDRYVIHFADGHFDAQGRPCWVLEPPEGVEGGGDAVGGGDGGNGGDLVEDES